VQKFHAGAWFFTLLQIKHCPYPAKPEPKTSSHELHE